MDINIHNHRVSQYMNTFSLLQDHFCSESIIHTFQYHIYIAYKTIHTQ